MRKITNYFPWITLVILCIYGVGINSLRNSFQFFLPYLAKDFNGTVTSIALSSGIFMVSSGIGGVISGWLIDRISIRKSLLLGNIIILLAAITLFQLVTAPSFVIVYGLIGGLGYGMSWGVPTQYYISQWFEKSKGLALALLNNCNSLGLAVLAPIWSRLSKNQPWQTTYRSLAICLLIIIPIVLITLRNPNQQKTAKTNNTPSTWKTTIKTAYYSKSIKYAFSAVFVCGFSMGIIDTQLVSMMINNQISTDKTGILMSLFGIIVIIGGLFSGIISDKQKKRIAVLQWLFLGRTISFLLLLLPVISIIKYSLFVLLFGLTYSGVVMLAVLLIVESKTAVTGKLLSINMLIHQFSGLLGVYLSSKLLDIFANYFAISLIALSLSLFVLLYGIKINDFKSKGEVL
ncbi:hypothetical protein ATZ33_00395 [Enterococcus silesiacus]|uniref:Major facilitator superfamily (MFS) profile domain-containing protein n=1 Tax=Enterococcus silesiacus TaxID=332949 RepID=A0A0S3K6Q8_9ENTE|nr:MFS transporter [Enterococcus silesiacus]ALR99892.1 hypothetical protein ATZ33_00395 [Enterococcus silesiacus]OJG92802.1 hypothetical protein RV15_GL002747 [Enterococcus silesiacus]